MSKMTMTQKILAAHAGLDRVEAGQLILVNLDMVLGNDITSPVAIREFNNLGATEVFDKDKPKKMALSVASVAFALVSVALCFLGVVGIILGVCSVVLALASRIYLKYFDKLSLIGIIVAIFGIVFGSVSIVWDFIVASDVILNSYYTIL